MPDTKIKTLLIEDSGFMRILLLDMLRKDGDIEVIATASNGYEGVEKVKALSPDVVITDMVMPQFDGLYVVQQLMKEKPVPIILLSSLDRTDPKIFDALNEGAFDFIDKPKEKQITEGNFPLSRLVKEASMADYIKLRHRAKGRNTHEHTFEATLNFDIIGIGASTGGPSAVELLINNLPANLSLPVVVAQHMPERFIESFALRLRDSTGLKVSVARQGEPLLSNHIYLAPGTGNIKIGMEGSCPSIQFSGEYFKEFNNPSIDCLFESLGVLYGARAIGVILTGMGKDGTKGLERIRAAGGLTIAQDEASSIVYGMPKAAFDSGAALHKISLTEIPNFIVSAL